MFGSSQGFGGLAASDDVLGVDARHMASGILRTGNWPRTGWRPAGETVMTLDEYVAWAAGIGVTRHGGVLGDGRLFENGLGLASEIGEVAGVLARRLRDDDWEPDRLADELGDVAYYWARLCAVTRTAPSTLLARSRAHVDWRRAGRPAGGPPAGAAPMTLEEYAAWAVAASEAGRAEGLDAQSLWDAGLALVGDAGEVAECLRRLAREGDQHRERLAGEVGDV
jgi:NTP pyrophosphatase (non-canonical NTP hydrolase)